MPNHPVDYKKKLGALLCKLKSASQQPSTEDERKLAEFLVDKQLAVYRGPERGPRGPMKAKEYYDFVSLQASAYYELTGEGHAFVDRLSDGRLLAGQFRLPGEQSWHERWPWRHGVITFIAAVLGSAVTIFVFRPERDRKPDPPTQPAPANAEPVSRPDAPFHP